MVVSVETVARRYENVSEGAPISVDIPAYEIADVKVFYGTQGIEAERNTDYTIELTGNFSTIIITPLKPLIQKINALTTGSSTETNFIVVRRNLKYTTESTPPAVRNTPFTSREFDRNAMRDAQLDEKYGRALRLPQSNIGGENTTLAGAFVDGTVLVVENGKVTFKSVAEVVDENTIGTSTDYGFVTGSVSDFTDYGALTE